MRLQTGLSALTLAAVSLLGMSDAEAKRIGYTTNCWSSDASSLIVQAGHTPVALNTGYDSLTADALVGLDGLFSSECSATSNANVDRAITNGLVVWFDDWSGQSRPLPGNRALVRGAIFGGVRVPAGAPWSAGPGGTASQAGLDAASFKAGFPIASLPSDVLVMATDPSGSRARVLSYPSGRGRVVVTSYATGCSLPGGFCASPLSSWPASGFPAAVTALTTNLFAWALPPFTSCAAEGYTGTKLTMCRSLCETTQTSALLTNKIKLYTAIYRETPPCGL